MKSFLQFIAEADIVGHTLWIDPKGKVHDMGSIEGNTHFEWIWRNWDKFFDTPQPKKGDRKDAHRVYDEPFEKGWVRVKNFYNSLDVAKT